MTSIESYLKQNFKFEDLISKNCSNYDDIKNYYENAEKDAIYFYNQIKFYLNNNMKILEVGGGIHLLTNYLKQSYDVTSVEPGNYSDGIASNVDLLRNNILKINNQKIHTTTLENFKTNEKFDFIFSMNVLEHTNNIHLHINYCKRLLKNKNSILYIECPNYSFPYEPHFCEFFIPFFPKFTFNNLKKKKLIKKFGEKKYFNILNSLNFNCNTKQIKRINLIKINNPIKDIFNRIEKDSFFKKRILSNLIIRFSYKMILIFKLKNLLTKIFPSALYPYLILKIKKDV